MDTDATLCMRLLPACLCNVSVAELIPALLVAATDIGERPGLPSLPRFCDPRRLFLARVATDS